MEDAETINDFMRDAIRTDVDELMGAGWLDSLMSQVSGANANVVDVVDQMLPSMTEFVGAKLRGEVSPEQARQFDMRMGEDVLRLYGRTDADDPQSRGYEVAQWMGQIEQNQLMGMQLAPGVAQFAGLPIQSAADVTNVTNPYRTDLANVSAMSSNLLGLAVQQGTVSPNTTLQVANQAMAQNLGTASQIAMANQQATMASATSMLNFQADRYAADMALQGALAGASATRSGGLLSGLGGLAGGIIASSDRRLKQDIVPVGSLPNGLTVYKFRYKWGGPVHTGLMADEVRQVHPEAVIRVGGYDAVDYGKAVL
jgi:hypothetical protein